MDIGEIRKRHQEFNEIWHGMNDEVWEKGLCDANDDRGDLLAYISTLEEKLRWKRVEEERPAINKKVLIKDSEGNVETGRLIETTIYDYFEWYNGRSTFPREFFPEWREI